MERIFPKTSLESTSWSLPELASTRRSSRRVPPRQTQISWARVPENCPTHAAVMAEDGKSE